MNKLFRATLGMLSFSIAATAQSPITLTDAGYPGLGNDTFRSILSMGAFTSLATPAANATWDISTASYTIDPGVYVRLAPTNPAFTGATFRSLLTTVLGSIDYITAAYYTRSSTGLAITGEEMTVRQAIGLGSLTGSMSDSIIFPVQTLAYNGGVRQKLKFPATLGTTWTSTARATLAFVATVSMFSLNNTPGQRRTTHIQQDSVIGWGVMRVKNAAGTASGWMNVLQVRSRQIAIDSFFLNGAPAPDNILSGFGLQQGQGDTSSHVMFYRLGEYTPLAEVIYVGPTAGGQPGEINVSQARLVSPAGIGDVDGKTNLTVFPNPLRGNTVFVKLPAGTRASYEVISLSGTVVATGRVESGPVGETAIVLPTDVVPGIYYLLLQDGNNREVVPFEIAP